MANWKTYKKFGTDFFRNLEKFNIFRIEIYIVSTRLKTENVKFLQITEKLGPNFLICFSVGHSAPLTKKLWLGNIGHIDFMLCDSVSGLVLSDTLN